MGIQADLESEKIDVQFRGAEDFSVEAHNNNSAYRGEITIEGQTVPDVIAILREGYHGRYQLISFWPDVQHPDAHKSYTDPLVDTAMAGSPYDIKTVSTVMHDCFRENAGVSPAALMQMLYQERIQEFKESQAEINQQLIDISTNLATATDRAEKYKRKWLETNEELESTQNTVELQKLQNQQSQSEIQALLEANAELENEVESLALALKHSGNESSGYSEIKSLVTQKAELVTKVWNSKTGSDYKNVGILGWVIDVTRRDQKIELTTLNTQGEKIIITDFGRFGFVNSVFEYLASRKGEAAVFIITWRPSGSPMLASDTMMLPQYRGLWEREQ